MIENRVVQHLTSTVDAMKMLHARNPKLDPQRTEWDKKYRFFNYYDLALQLGEPFQGATCEGMDRGLPQQCFANAFHVANATGWAMDYYEGYAMSADGFMAVAHAWNVDPTDGRVYDTTWPNPEQAHYLGVRIDQNVYFEATRRSGYNSVLESDWLADSWFIKEGWKQLTRAGELELV